MPKSICYVYRTRTSTRAGATTCKPTETPTWPGTTYYLKLSPTLKLWKPFNKLWPWQIDVDLAKNAILEVLQSLCHLMPSPMTVDMSTGVLAPQFAQRAAP